MVYPHLYPYFSPPFNQEVQTQLNVLDTASTLTIVDGFLAVAASPLLVRGDAWSLIPAGLILIAAIAYQGAKSAAGRHAIHLSAAFDLHRFDMLRAMHRQLPENAVDEYADNEKLCRVLAGRRPIDEPEPECRVYIHPSPTKEENLDSEITVSREEST